MPPAKKAKTAAFELEFSYLGNNLYRSPIRAVMMPARERKDAGEDISLLAGGCPHESFFPAKALALELRDGTTTAPVDLDKPLQYHKGSGVEALRSRLEAIQRRVHGRGAWGVACSTVPRRRTTVAVAMDAGGVVPAALEATLAALPRKQRVFYTISSGQNPTGCTPTEERKQEVYAICRKYDVVILEDDPYYFLAMPLDYESEADMPGADPAKLPASYLSMDVDGRVVRLDSAAKIVAPGLRLGWVSAPMAFLDKFTVLNETSVQFPSGAAQAAMLALLETWRDDAGFDAALRRRSTSTRGAATSSWPRSAARSRRPAARRRDADAGRGHDKLIKNGVACIPGACFATPDKQGDDCPFLRLTYASATDAEMRAGASRLAATLADYSRNPSRKYLTADPFGDDEAPAALDAAPAAAGEAAAADDETEILVLSREAAAYLYGRGGNTMRRLADFSGCVIEMHMTKNTVEIKGSEYSRELAKLCVRVTMAQRGNHLGTLDFEEIAARCDCATVDVPTSAVGFVMGSKGATLRELESRHNAFLVFDNDTVRDDAKRIYEADAPRYDDPRGAALRARARTTSPTLRRRGPAAARRRRRRRGDRRPAPRLRRLRGAAAARDYDRGGLRRPPAPPDDPRALDPRALDPRAVDPRLDPRYAAPPPRYADDARYRARPPYDDRAAAPRADDRDPYRDYRAAPPPRRDYAPPEPRAYDPYGDRRPRPDPYDDRRVAQRR
ncbi:2-aminoadipate transaminase [Aureococcus anophagefferens]|nr:2-aminoadipate transaminase [Aureococcus anophagefferens]